MTPAEAEIICRTSFYSILDVFLFPLLQHSACVWSTASSTGLAAHQEVSVCLLEVQPPGLAALQWVEVSLQHPWHCDTATEEDSSARGVVLP